MNELARWLKKQERGALTRLFRASGVSWHTVNRARRGEKVGLKMAIKISQATGGEVAVQSLTDDADVLESREPLAVA